MVIVERFKDTGVREYMMECCVLLRRREIEFGDNIYEESLMERMIEI